MSLSAKGSDGRLSPLESVGGVRGLLEVTVPGALFTGVYAFTQNLTWSVGAALASGVVFAALGLIQRRKLTQVIAGMAGLLISALAARTSGQAESFFLPGLIMNAVYFVLFAVSIAVGHPVAGYIFSMLRDEWETWRRDPARVRAYSFATAAIAALFLVRLAVKLPLMLQHKAVELGIMNALLGVPAYALTLWIAWMLSSPARRRGTWNQDSSAPSGAPSLSAESDEPAAGEPR